MKKLIVCLLLVLSMCVSLVACDTSNTNNPSGDKEQSTAPAEKVRYEVPAAGYDGSEVTITFSHTMNQEYQKVLDRYIAKFNEIYPNITVEHSQVGGYDEVRDTIKTELTANNQPNIAYCYPDHVALYNITKKVVPLDNFIESKIEVKNEAGEVIEILGFTDEQKADFVPGYYAEGAVFDAAGTMYTLPMSKSTEVIYYNKTFFEANNIEVPTTWDEMRAVCEKIKQIDPNCIPLGYDSEANWFITMCEQYESPYTSSEKGKYFLFNNEQNQAFVKEFRSWYDAKYVTTKELYGGYTSGLFTNQDSTKPTSYMSIGSTGGASHQTPDPVDGVYPFEVGIAPIPTVEGKELKAISQGPSLCIFDSDNKQEVVASWLFVKFLTTNQEFQAAFSMTSGYMPVIKSVTDPELAANDANGKPNAVASYINFLDKANGTDKLQALAVKTGIEISDSYFVSPAFNGSSLARDQVGALLQYCLATDYAKAGYASVDAMIDDAFKTAVAACWKNA